MIYLIGGPARCGKSTLAAQVRKEIDGHVLSGDAMVHALQAVLDPRAVPDIFDHDIASVHTASSSEAKIDRLRRRDEQMWQVYQAYCETALFDAPKDDILIEGNIWPDYLELFSRAHMAVFLIDTSQAQGERLKAIRDGGGNNNWIHDFSDERLLDWGMFNAARSRRYAELCDRHNYVYFDIAEHGIEKTECLAFEYLLEKTL